MRMSAMALAHVLIDLRKAHVVSSRWGGILGDAHITYGTSSFANYLEKRSEMCLTGAACLVKSILTIVVAHLRMISTGSLSSVSLGWQTP